MIWQHTILYYNNIIITKTSQHYSGFVKYLRFQNLNRNLATIVGKFGVEGKSNLKTVWELFSDSLGIYTPRNCRYLWIMPILHNFSLRIFATLKFFAVFHGLVILFLIIWHKRNQICFNYFFYDFNITDPYFLNVNATICMILHLASTIFIIIFEIKYIFWFIIVFNISSVLLFYLFS